MAAGWCRLAEEGLLFSEMPRDLGVRPIRRRRQHGERQIGSEGWALCETASGML